MSRRESHHVTVELKKNYQFAVRFDDIKGTPTLLCDEPAPIGDGEGPGPADLLGAAVGTCLAGSLAYCLRKGQLDPLHLRARVTTHIDRTGKDRPRIASIEVELTPDLASGGGDGETQGHELLGDFCTVTASIRKGIPVSVSLTDATKPAA